VTPETRAARDIDPDWREKIEHALRIQADTRAYRDADPIGIIRYRPLHVRWPA
jgi:hypothetical protein